MNWVKDKTLGYIYCIDKESPYANKQGKVYQHHYIICELIGRKLEPDECVHHIDRDRANNDPSNLLLLTKSEHSKLHQFEDNGYIYIEDLRECVLCGNTFTVSSTSTQSFCSVRCSSVSARRFDVTREELEDLAWKYPTTKIAEMFKVSDVAISKRCKLMGIKKPARGYWAKVYAKQEKGE